MNADICIIQECEKLKEDYFPNAKFFGQAELKTRDWVFLSKMEVLLWTLSIIQI